jgi:hypothetical protein
MKRSEKINRALKEMDVAPLSSDFSSKVMAHIEQKQERVGRQERIILSICAGVCVLASLMYGVRYIIDLKVFDEVILAFSEMKINVWIVVIVTLMAIADVYLRRYLFRQSKRL